MRAVFFAVLLLLAAPRLVYAMELLTTHIHTAHERTVTLRLETALDEMTREQGLMHRKTLGEGDGMAFFFPKTAPYKFWMKDTLLPLDILFVDEAGRIVYIATAHPLSLEYVGSNIPVETVIEIAGGRAAHEGIAVGDKVTYEINTSPRSMAH